MPIDWAQREGELPIKVHQPALTLAALLPLTVTPRRTHVWKIGEYISGSRDSVWNCTSRAWRFQANSSTIFVKLIAFRSAKEAETFSFIFHYLTTHWSPAAQKLRNVQWTRKKRIFTETVQYLVWWPRTVQIQSCHTRFWKFLIPAELSMYENYNRARAKISVRNSRSKE